MVIMYNNSLNLNTFNFPFTSITYKHIMFNIQKIIVFINIKIIKNIFLIQYY